MLNLRVIQALRESQKTNGEQSTKIKSLCEEIQLLRDQLASSTASLASMSSKSSKKSTAALALTGGDKILGLGKKFCTVEGLWLDPEIFDLQYDFTDHLDSPARFATDISYKKGTLAALYIHVPKNLHESMVHVMEFRTTVHFLF